MGKATNLAMKIPYMTHNRLCVIPKAGTKPINKKIPRQSKLSLIIGGTETEKAGNQGVEPGKNLFVNIELI